jgi:hypothetical protein
MSSSTWFARRATSKPLHALTCLARKHLRTDPSNRFRSGPYNSWDRQPYLTNSGVDDGYTADRKMGSSGSIIKRHDTITKNIWINGYNGKPPDVDVLPASSLFSEVSVAVRRRVDDRS